MDISEKPVSLEGEILQGRYAIVEVTQVLGDWICCVLFDMQAMTRREAVVELREGAEPEVQLLPVEEPAQERPAAPAASAAEEELPAPPPEPPSAPARRHAKPDRLEAAWFALGAEMEDRSDVEQEPDVEDGDVVIAPSKVEKVASELTTKTYMRYTLNQSGASHQVTADSAAFAVLRQKKAPIVLALIGLAVVAVVILVLFTR